MPDRSAAVYARYSSANQSQNSIQDQISSCRRYAAEHELTILENHIYTDHAVSGARRDREGWSALMSSAAQRCFGVVVVEDLSRMSRDLTAMLNDLADLKDLGISVSSVADNIDTLKEEALLVLQFKGIINEQHLRDLRTKTHRGQVGQKERGYIVGEATFGYRSEPVGEFRAHKSGRPRPDGYRMRVDEVQAAVVRRIFREYADGRPLTRIVRDLNRDAVPGRYRSSGGWSPGTVSRMLDNLKYTGVWIWNRTRNRRTRSGRCRPEPRPESEWMVNIDEELRIIDQPLWEAVQSRRRKVRGVFPGGRGRRGFSTEQRSAVEVSPPHLLSGAMECGACGGGVGLVSGKGTGYYGCFAAAKRACGNRVKVPRQLAEDTILRSVEARLADAGVIRRVLLAVERQLGSLSREVPDALSAKRSDLRREERRQARLVEFVADGRGTKAVREELEKLEPRIADLRAEVGGLERASATKMRAPTEAWIRGQVGRLRSVLESRTSKSADLLRRLLCPIRLVPVVPATGRPYFQAHTALDTLELLAESESGEDSDPGANSLRWWRRRESNPGPRIRPHGTLHAYPRLLLRPRRESAAETAGG